MLPFTSPPFDFFFTLSTFCHSHFLSWSSKHQGKHTHKHLSTKWSWRRRTRYTSLLLLTTIIPLVLLKWIAISLTNPSYYFVQNNVCHANGSSDYLKAWLCWSLLPLEVLALSDSRQGNHLQAKPARSNLFSDLVRV